MQVKVASKSPGMICLVTTNPYTESEDFTEADLVVDQLGDETEVKVSIQDLMNLTD